MDRFKNFRMFFSTAESATFELNVKFFGQLAHGSSHFTIGDPSFIFSTMQNKQLIFQQCSKKKAKKTCIDRKKWQNSSLKHAV